jgi:hypothetical protein
MKQLISSFIGGLLSRELVPGQSIVGILEIQTTATILIMEAKRTSLTLIVLGVVHPHPVLVSYLR